MKLETADDQLMAMAAHRYCLGRSSYIVSTCTAWLRETWPQINAKTRHVILRDTIEALRSGRAGDDIDVKEWQAAADWMIANMPDDESKRAYEAAAWRTT